MTKLDFYTERLGASTYHCVLTHWLDGPDRPFRYDIVPVGLFERINEGRFYRLAQSTQEHWVKDFAEVHLSQGNSFIHNEERIKWIDELTQGLWHVELGDPQLDPDGAHLLWSFSNVNDALLFKLTWYT